LLNSKGSPFCVYEQILLFTICARFAGTLMNINSRSTHGLSVISFTSIIWTNLFNCFVTCSTVWVLPGKTIIILEIPTVSVGPTAILQY
jgi:hypothetical protein